MACVEVRRGLSWQENGLGCGDRKHYILKGKFSYFAVKHLQDGEV